MQFLGVQMNKDQKTPFKSCCFFVFFKLQKKQLLLQNCKYKHENSLSANIRLSLNVPSNLRCAEINFSECFPRCQRRAEAERGNIILKRLFFFCFWPFRTESGLRLCQLHRPKGCRESHQHVKWTQTSDQNDQGNRHAARQ